MIRKMLVVAAAVAMPAASIAGVTAVAGSGIASAKALPIAAGSYDCALTGSVTFAKPGLSHNGVVTNKLVETSKAAVTPSGDCGTKTIKAKINTDTTLCGVTPSTDAAACTDPANAKNISIGKNRYYNTTSSLASAGVANIVSSLGPTGLSSVLLGNKVTLAVTSGGTSSVTPGGVCGAGIGFHLEGATSVAGLTYVLNLCLTGDTGTNTTNSFFTDFLTSAGGDNSVAIASGVFGGSSNLHFTKA